MELSKKETLAEMGEYIARFMGWTSEQEHHSDAPGTWEGWRNPVGECGLMVDFAGLSTDPQFLGEARAKIELEHNIRFTRRWEYGKGYWSACTAYDIIREKDFPRGDFKKERFALSRCIVEAIKTIKSPPPDPRVTSGPWRRDTTTMR